MTEMANTCDQSITSLKSEAIKINNIMKVLKSSITWNVLRCQKLLDQFKLEQCNSTTSPILKETAQEFDSIYGKTKFKLEEINRNWEKFIQLSGQTINGSGEEELNK